MTYPTLSSRTIVILGASYGGHRAIQVLLPLLPPGWRLVVLERNTHANHLYAFPRMSVVRHHEHKAFIPYIHIFKSALTQTHQHRLIQANVVAIDADNKRVAYRRIEQGEEKQVEWLGWEYLVYALGSHLPDPINVWSKSRAGSEHDGSKKMGIQWLRDAQRRIEQANSVVVVGGGALGVQLASDIASTYGTSKKVTLTHSRTRLLPRFDAWMHDKAAARLQGLGVELVLGSRVDLATVSADQKSFRLVDGRRLSGDLVLFCLGQTPNTSLLPATSLSASGQATVLPTMQLQHHPHIFVVGDAADAFGALNAGHTAWDQAEVAARNIAALIRRSHGGHSQAEAEEERETKAEIGEEVKVSASAGDKPKPTANTEAELQEYHPTPPAVKVTLGLDRMIRQTMAGGFVEVEGGAVDLNSTTMWTRRGLGTDDLFL
ncbi:cytochrome b [Thecaphora frezii]